MSKSQPSQIIKTLQSIHHWLAPALVFLYQIVGVVAFGIYPLLAADWVKIPFIGSFLDHTLYFNSSTPIRPGTWEIQKMKWEFGYRLSAIDGLPISDVAELYDTLERYSIGDVVEVQAWTAQGDLTTHNITLIHFPTIDQWGYIITPYAIGLIYLFTGLWVFGLRRRDATGRAFAVFTTSAAIAMAGLFDISTTNRLTQLWTAAIAMMGGSLVSLAFIFPQEMRFIPRHPYLRWVGYAVAGILILNAVPTIYNYQRPDAYVGAWRLEYIFAGLSVLTFLGISLLRFFTTSLPVVREQARWTLIAASIAFGPMAVFFIITVIQPAITFTPFLFITLIVFPPVIAYTILRYRLLKTDYLLSRVLIYTLMIVLIAISYGLLVTGLSHLLAGSLLLKSPFVSGLIIFVLALLFLPLRVRLQQQVDRIFARGQGAYRAQIQLFSRELTQAMDLATILSLLRRYINDNLMPVQVHTFTHDVLSDFYVAAADHKGNGNRHTSDLRFAPTSALVQTLGSQRQALYISDFSQIPKGLQPEQARIALLGAQLFIPLPGREGLTGWVALSQRRSGEPYNSRDIEFLEAISDQASLAIERAQVVADLERRIHAMNVLTRVSQGINVTLAFDDILELIYAQTNQVIPTRDFRIALHDKHSDYLYFAFFLENDERISTREGRPIPFGQGLEREVMRLRRALITDDYERECRGRGALPSAQGLYAWIGVPLNTGAETIGVLTLGSRDPSVIYTEEQGNLVQALADQAAGAIIKARLLQEAERRTRQLTTLNEVARSLSSTLDIDPLLKQILNSAVEILNCEAGSLLLAEPETGELVFEVVLGPASDELLGKRMSPGAGLVGKAVEERQPIIQNDVRRTKEWSEAQDQETGFTTNDLLVVPMQVKDQVLGAIEVINRKDGLPFSQDDQELLMAFTSQAAVALENARLYNLTDQTLAARVEELAVMQRIDRELNASLDVDRAMRITLEWAMRQSRSDAGLVGVHESDVIRIMASQGYDTELNTYKDQTIPTSVSSIRLAIDTSQAQCLHMADSDLIEGSAYSAILKGGKSQVVIPIRRETEVIGILLLESRTADTCPEDVIAFLSRLSDHAAIAISNAQLYTAVQAANLAKSDFVSFVSHELKTPMTSIRGFTDLLASGVVGVVNENQSNFLNTIRSNVDRMATLVSDLADVSRIEAGRLRLDFAAVPVAEVVEEVVRSSRAQMEAKEQTLELKIPETLPDMWGDRIRLIQVLTNLVNNAYKYTPQGGHIQINAEETQNRWDPDGAPRVIHIAVQDNGLGISPENQAKIFQKFFRADDRRIQDIPGTGLGLNITKTLVENQGGRIWFESEVGKGTVFHFTTPVVETEEKQADA
ncbi:MAG: GAF domain-containing protein [Anaerolineales bacterium]|nr:GAF domain-containing protein [Anaerolineales bacterium]